MCMVSMILDRGQRAWPDVHQQPNELAYWKQWQDAYRKAQEYDKLTKQPDCEDINKLPILQKILDRLAELEKKIDAK